MPLEHRVETGRDNGQAVFVGLRAVFARPCGSGIAGFGEVAEQGVECTFPYWQEGAPVPVEQCIGIQHLDGVTGGRAWQGQGVYVEWVAKGVVGEMHGQ